MIWLRKTIRFLFFTALILITGLYLTFYWFTKPKSDTAILKSYKNSIVKPKLSYDSFKNFNFRKIKLQHNDSLPTIIFVHGTIGSVNDFNRYLNDNTLQQHYNMLAYDRIGYNYNDKHQVQESIAFEREHLDHIINQLATDKIILVGYSYGGPIALASKQQTLKTILLAPAVYSEVEPMPWALNFYRWQTTRWLVPPIWKQASKEKISHKNDLKNFENNWKSNTNNIISIHGDGDWVVPLENSVFLQEQLPKNQFKLVTIQGAGHELVWSEFDFIKQQLLNLLD